MSIAFPAFDAPPWALRIFILVSLLGFPITLVLAWIFDATSQGVRFDSSNAGSKRLFAIAALLTVLALGWYFYGQPSFRKGEVRAAVPDKSIAVLAFTDLSPGHDQEYFSDGMAEEILNALAKVRDLKVAGRTSSFYYKGRNQDLRTIGKALGVANVLEGSVRTQGNKVRITAQLIRSDDDFQIWSESYDGDLSDVFALQERIARAITDKLQVSLQGEQKTRLVPVSTSNPEAYALYLQATDTFNRRDGKHMADAIAQLHEAIHLDPQYARAYSRLAALYAVSPIYMAAAVAPAFDAAEQQWQAAMKLDPGLAEPYAVLGYVRAEQRRHLESYQGFKRALELDPDDVTANFWHALALLRWGYTKQGDAALDRVLAIEPLLPNGLLWRSVEYFYAGDQANAERLARRAEEVGLPSAGWALSALAEARGQKPEAIKYLTAMWRFISPGYPAGDPEIFVQGIFGDESARVRAFAQIDHYLASKPVSLDCTVVLALIRLGEPARALTLAQGKLTANDGVWLTLLWSPNGRAARATPQFQTFIHRFGLVELWDQYGAPDVCHKTDKSNYACE
jgi:TolB-like protein/Tfp pilus assembly protein PilF